MQHKHAVKAVDRTLRDLMGVDLPFGGKVVLFSGDFRQTLPVVRGGNLFEQANVTLKASPLWTHVEHFALTKNMRLEGNNTANGSLILVQENYRKIMFQE